MDSLPKLLPFAVMITLECCDVGLTTLTKAALSRGMNHFAFVVYSNAAAAVLPSPFAFIVESIKIPTSDVRIENKSQLLFIRCSQLQIHSVGCRKKRPPLTLYILCRFSMLALCGITAMQNFVFTGLGYTSPTLASAMANLIPAFTFILAIIFRLEKVRIRSSSSQAKILGALISVGGAMVVILYKGPVIRKFWYSNHHVEQSHNVAEHRIVVKDWIIGSCFLVGASISWSIWNVMQVATLKKYPAELSITAFTSFFATIQSAILTFLAEHNLAAWSLKWDLRVISILYSAIIGTGLTYTMQAWCNNKKGPVFVASFKPLSIVIAAIMGSIVLGDKLHIGSVAGVFFIVSGFYAVIWGQSKDDQMLSTDPTTSQSEPIDRTGCDTQQPLLGHRASSS